MPADGICVNPLLLQRALPINDDDFADEIVGSITPSLLADFLLLLLPGGDHNLISSAVKCLLSQYMFIKSANDHLHIWP